MTREQQRRAIYAVEYLTDWGWHFYGLGRDRTHASAREYIKEARAEWMGWAEKPSNREAKRRFRIHPYLPQESDHAYPQESSMSADDLFVTEVADPGPSCEECKCSFGIHLVTCSHFFCKKCGQNGPKPDNHYGGCPNGK